MPCAAEYCTQALFLTYFSIHNLCELPQVLVHIMRHLGCPLLFIFQEGVFQIVESLVLFVHRHKLFVRALTLQIFAVGVIYLACGIEQFSQVSQSPIAQSTCHGVVEDIRSPSVLDELAEAALHQLVAQDGIGQERMLRGIEPGHRLGGQRAAQGLVIGIREDTQESVHALGCGTTQGLVGDLYLLV